MVGIKENGVRVKVLLGLAFLTHIQFSVSVDAYCIAWSKASIDACKKAAWEARVKEEREEQERYQGFLSDLSTLRSVQQHNETHFDHVEHQRILKPLEHFEFKTSQVASPLALVENFENDFKLLEQEMKMYLENTGKSFRIYFDAKVKRLNLNSQARLNRYHDFMESLN